MENLLDRFIDMFPVIVSVPVHHFPPCKDSGLHPADYPSGHRLYVLDGVEGAPRSVPLTHLQLTSGRVCTVDKTTTIVPRRPP